MSGNIFSTIVFAVAVALSAGCSSSEFSGTGGKKAVAAPKQNTPAQKAAGDSEPETGINTPVESQDAMPGGIETPEESVTQCPKVAQDVLLLDLNSGWFAGAGGQLFAVAFSNVTGECVGSVRVEFHHILETASVVKAVFPGTQPGSVTDTETGPTPDFATLFDQKDWNRYTQVWILSGSSDDPDDIVVSNPFFQSVLDAIAGSSARLFIGGGMMSVNHANALSAKLGMGNVFTSQMTLDDPAWENPPSTMGGRLQVGRELEQSGLFANGVTSIASGFKPVRLNLGAGFKVLGRGVDGQPVIAAGSIGETRRIVVDGDLARFYSVSGVTMADLFSFDPAAPGAANFSVKDQETLQYLQNILVYLSGAGG